MSRLKNQRHELFAKNLILCQGNQSQAYALTYPNSKQDNSHRVSGSTLMAKMNVRERVQELLLGQDKTHLVSLFNKLAGLTEAKKQIVCDKVLAIVEDNPTQLEAVKTILKLYGLLGNTLAINQDNRSINFSFGGNDTERLTAIACDLEQLNNKLLTRPEVVEPRLVDVDDEHK